MYRKTVVLLFGLAVLSGVSVALAKNAGLEARAALERLKSLAGEWEGTAMSSEGPAAAVHYRVTANGHTVMEVLFPGTDHEMISMYYLDADELVMKHYCAMGNQPEAKLDRSTSSEGELNFVFTGGSNLDPARDGHIHGGKIVLTGKDRLENEWVFWEGGKPASANRFYLTRKTSP